VHAEKRGRWMLYSVDAAAFERVTLWLAPFAGAGAAPVTCAPSCAANA
jgi:hypothetical protein